MKAQVNDKIRIVNKMNDWCMDYEEGEVFTVESTWYGGVNVISRTGVPLSIDEVEYEIIGGEKEKKGQIPGGKILFYADSLSGVFKILEDIKDILEYYDKAGTGVEILVLALREGVKGFLAEDMQEEGNREALAELYGKGVKFTVCGKALKALGIEEKELYPNVKVKEPGIAELVERQLQGYACVKE